MGVLEAILSVFSAVGEWIPTAVQTVTDMFYTPGANGTEGQLTFLGVLAVAGLAFSIVFLIEFGEGIWQQMYKLLCEFGRSPFLGNTEPSPFVGRCNDYPKGVVPSGAKRRAPFFGVMI